MSRENIEIVQASFAAMGRGDVDGLLELYDPDVEFLPLTGTQVETGGYHGHSGVRAYFAEIAEIWDQLRPYADNIETSGDNVVVLGGCAVRGRGSMAESDSPMAWVITVKGGRIASHRGYRTSDEALEAAGLHK
jgi:ketosteroid isomerase-like protein